MATRTGRVFAVCYDLSKTPKRKIYQMLSRDWKHLVDDMEITKDGRYLHDKGKPVLFVSVFYSDRFGPDLANGIIDFFKNDPKYAVTLIEQFRMVSHTEKEHGESAKYLMIRRDQSVERRQYNGGRGARARVHQLLGPGKARRRRGRA